MKAIFIQQNVPERDTTIVVPEEIQEKFFCFFEEKKLKLDMYILHHCDCLIYSNKNSCLYFYAQLHDIDCIEYNKFMAHYKIVADVSKNPEIYAQIRS